MKKVLSNSLEVTKYVVYTFLVLFFCLSMVFALPSDRIPVGDISITIRNICFSFFLLLYPRESKFAIIFSKIIIYILFAVTFFFLFETIKHIFMKGIHFSYLQLFLINIVWLIMCFIVAKKLNIINLFVFTNVFFVVVSINYSKIFVLFLQYVEFNNLVSLNFSNYIKIVYILFICMLVIYMIVTCSIILINKRKKLGIYIGVGICTIQGLLCFSALLLKDLTKEMVVEDVINGLVSVGVVVLLLILKHQWNKQKVLAEKANGDLIVPKIHKTIEFD